jgi:hypothetical protein
VRATRRHVQKVSTQGNVIAWTITNKTAAPLARVQLVDFFSKGGAGGVPFVNATIPPFSTANAIPSGGSTVITATHDGDFEVFEYSILLTVGNTVLLVKDPELEMDL